MYSNFQKDADELQALIMEDAQKVYSEKVIERWLNPRNLEMIRKPEWFRKNQRPLRGYKADLLQGKRP